MAIFRALSAAPVQDYDAACCTGPTLVEVRQHQSKGKQLEQRNQAERTALALAEMARGGFRLDDDTVERLAAAQAYHARWTRWALWTGALALAAMAVWLIMPVG